MGNIGHVESLWRYPVKSMRGQEIAEAFLGFAGVYGDRLYALRDAAAQKGFPFLTGREQEGMLLYQPRFRHPDRVVGPPNLADAEKIAPGATPVYGTPADLLVDIEAPSGQVLAVDDPTLLAMLSEGLDERHSLTLQRSERALTDCRPVSLFSLQTVKQLGDEVGLALDKRSFRANIYASFEAMSGFAEDALVGRRLQVGSKAVIAMMDRDPRCKMITLDPNTAEARPEVLRRVTQAHDGKAGLYGVVLIEGTIRSGDDIILLD
jgi:MOSC domain-containing protein